MSKEDTSSEKESKLSYDAEEVTKNLDSTIANFSDADSHCPHMSEEDSIVRKFAPVGLEEPFQELYTILNTSLSTHLDATTASAVLMGPRGSGKSLLLERCLAACQLRKDVKFRHVFINGIVVRGQDVASVIYEIVKQLSDLAIEDDVMDKEPNNKRQKLTKEKYLFRLRKATFTSNMALLESTFKIAEVDKIPILLVLDELDSFTDEGERQVLLYHLLDRVATPGSNLCLIGLTSSFTTLSLLEKRIRSRAEGACKVIYVRPPGSYEDLIKVIRQKLNDCIIRDDVLRFVSAPQLSNEKNDKFKQITKIPSCLEREFRCGKDMRWFSRVISTTLSLYRHECVGSTQAVTFTPQHLIDSLVMMGASISDDETSATRQLEVHLMDGKAVDQRIQALLDLSQPQVTVLLCARRILAREAHRENMKVPLTAQRILKEFESFRRGGDQLISAVYDLLEIGLLVPAFNHSGGGALQYHVSNAYKNMDTQCLRRFPLHFPVALDRELDYLLKSNLLDCTTALKEWGSKSN